jgi:GTP-binding protein
MPMTSAPFRVAIVGRPNVGKSTLFNRLVGRRKAVVAPLRGTTRDRLSGDVTWQGVRFEVTDTAGFEFERQEGLNAAVQRQVRAAVRAADAFILVCDGQQGLLPPDEMIMTELRGAGRPVAVAVNKCDDRLLVPADFHRLAPAQVFAVSALHGRGTGELLDHIVGLRDQGGKPGPGPDPWPWMPSLAIVGRQNVGKSSLVNAILQEERVLVSEQPGTTRDAIDTVVTIQGAPLRLIDTAGLRHRRKVREPVDVFSMARTAEVLGRCDAAVVLLDATQGVTTDDRRIVSQACDAGCGLVLAPNKWDLITGGNEEKLAGAVHRMLPMALFAPVVALSAKTGWHVPDVLDAAQRVVANIRRGVTEEVCREVLTRAWDSHLPPRFRGRAIRLKSVRWLPGRPPRLELATGPIGRLPMPYQHYLLKRLYAHPAFFGMPVQLAVIGPNVR